MRHQQPSLHVTHETKLSLPVQVELVPADSFVFEGLHRRIIHKPFGIDRHRYMMDTVSDQTFMPRETGCLLEDSRYRFYSGVEDKADAVLSPWDCRDEFLREGVTLRQCAAGLSAETVGRDKAPKLSAIRPADYPTHAWAIEVVACLGSLFVCKVQDQPDSTLSAFEVTLDQECSAWRALLRDALQMDYADWKQLSIKHPAAWVDELLGPIPMRIETKEGAPVARVVCRSVIDVLIVTTQLDGIRGLRQRVCKAEGCGKMFAVGNYDHKIYCDDRCAHRQAVRDGRKRKREAVERARNKARNATKKRGW